MGTAASRWPGSATGPPWQGSTGRVRNLLQCERGRERDHVSQSEVVFPEDPAEEVEVEARRWVVAGQAELGGDAAELDIEPWGLQTVNTQRY